MTTESKSEPKQPRLEDEMDELEEKPEIVPVASAPIWLVRFVGLFILACICIIIWSITYACIRWATGL